MNDQTTESPPSQPVIKADECLNPDCRRTQMARGLCRNCYATAAGLIRRGKITWADLERAGKSLPNRNVKPRGSITAWLLPTPPTE